MLTSLLINGFRSRLQECLDSQLLVGRVFKNDDGHILKIMSDEIVRPVAFYVNFLVMKGNLNNWAEKDN